MLSSHAGYGQADSDDEHSRKKNRGEPTEALEEIPLDEEDPGKSTRIGADLEGKIKKGLIYFLRKNIDVFA